jgi:gliding motility-associated-like protein
MKKRLQIILGLLIFVLVSEHCLATHIVGGNVEMKAIGNVPGKYKIVLKIYMDQSGASTAEPEESVGIYRKAGNGEMKVFAVPLIYTKKVTYENEACTEARRLKTLFAYYELDIALDPGSYADPDGYYLMWRTCCRNGNVINIQTPQNTEIFFKTDFPPLIKSGKPFLDSSPAFSELDGAYICNGEPFYFPFDAVDVDGDELRYSMENPVFYNGNRFGASPWAAGYSAVNAIPGNPALRVDAKTGLFVFSVMVEEFRNGELIGSVQRDYQFYVVDCPPVAPPTPTILVDNRPVTSASVCEGQTVTLTNGQNPEWNYQWKRDGRNIEGANGASLIVSQSGEYQLVTSLAGSCSKSGRSEKVNVEVTRSGFKLKYEKPAQICETGGSVSLFAIRNSNYTYKWFKDDIAVSETSDSILAGSPGRYWAVITDRVNGCTSKSDTASVLISEAPIMDSITPFCGKEHEAMLLNAKPAGGQFSGHGVVADKFDPKIAGVGTHEITYSLNSSGGCAAETKQLAIVRELPTADAGTDIYVQEGERGLIGNTALANLTYAWSPPDGLDDPLKSQPEVTPAKETVYTLQVTDEFGCTSTAKVTVRITNKVWIPNAFSPDADGVNETWELKGIDSYPKAEVHIYNRWGEVIFYSKGYAAPFDGSAKGIRQTPGVYVYKIKLDDAVPVVRGEFLLLR